MNTDIYKIRRKEAKNYLPDNSVLILPGNNLCMRNSDSSYPFRQESSFYYYSGFSEPDSLILISKESNNISSTIFVPKKDKLKEIWDGFRHGPKGAIKDFLFDEAYDNDEIDERLPELLSGKDSVMYVIGGKDSFDQKVIEWVQKANTKDRHSKSININDASAIIGARRLIKDSTEIEIIRQACAISAQAHIAAMKAVRPKMNEQMLESIYQYEFSKRGGRFTAYTPIVAGGENACVLHYIKNDEVLNDGDLVLVDAGCEYKMYASDITRTYPVSGKFSPEQKAIYEIVYEANQACIEAVKIGNDIMQVQEISERIILQGLIDLKILKGDLNDLYENNSHKDFYMHKVGHWLGLDVHDVGSYVENDNYTKFREGMITTIEPGIYISSNLNVDEKWKGIGVRIEDDILVTEKGNENLTSLVPSEINEIEKLMS
jgi:Xaa-Pro aminopeptidase